MLIEATEKRYRALIATACQGMRLSKLLALRWSDVELNSNRLYVRQVLRSGNFYEPKTESSRRSSAVPQVIIEKLKIHKLNQAVELSCNEFDLVFSNSVGRPIEGRIFIDVFLNRH